MRAALRVVVAVGALSLVAAPPTAVAVPMCLGHPVTVQWSGTIIGGRPYVTGTSGNDVIMGTGASDVIGALAGHDIICGLSGDDFIQGMSGNDVIAGGFGTSWVDGGSGIDEINYRPISQGVTVDLVTERAYVGQFIQRLDNIENVHGSLYDDILRGDDGNNQLHGDSGYDVLRGRFGDDTLTGAAGNDTLIGGPGQDWASFPGNPPGLATGSCGVGIAVGVLVVLADGVAYGDGDDTLTGIENVQGSNLSDCLLGDSAQNTLWGGLSPDLLSGGGGNDYLYGSEHNDTLQGGPGNDLLNGGSGTDDSCNGGSGADQLVGCELKG
jgi:Ca2+-binding RTX toxin-like protein